MEVEKRFRNIVITMPQPVDNEAGRIVALLDADPTLIVHLRHPGLGADSMAEIIDAVPPQLRGRLRLHDYFELLQQFPDLGGVHLNSRNPTAPAGAASVSRSCHSFDEVRRELPHYDYVTLSPVFESITKPGYGAGSDLLDLPSDLQRTAVVALGGVCRGDGPLLRRHGFAGMARMGSVWTHDNGAHRVDMQLQFITDAPDSVDATVAQALAALAGGCRWTQIRMKDADDSRVEQAARRLMTPYRQAGAVLIVNDRVDVARRLGMDGVHIGKNDMSPSQARHLLGPKAIIGATANCIDDIVALSSQPIDYLGIGPFRFTTTKKKLAPVIGLEGYRTINNEMLRRGITLPYVAIGGITADDIAPLHRVGVRGIAISGAIAHAAFPEQATRELLNIINEQ